MGRASGIHAIVNGATEPEPPDHWAGPLTDEAVDELLDAIEAVLDADTTQDGIVRSWLFRDFREHHVARSGSAIAEPADIAAIGEAAAFIEEFLRPDPEFPPLPIFSSESLARLAALAERGKR